MLECCQDVVARVNFYSGDMSGGMLPNVASIVKASFGNAAAASRDLCRKLAREMAHKNIYGIGQILRPLARMHPEIFLDEILTFDPVYDGHDGAIRHAVAKIEDGIVIQWCKQNPGERYPRAGRVVRLWQDAEDKKKKLTPIARHFIDHAPDKEKVLDALWRRGFRFQVVSGSRMPILESDLALVNTIGKHKHPQVKQWARQMTESIREQIRREKASDDAISTPSGFE